MQRKDFIKKSSLGLMGLIFAPGMLLGNKPVITRTVQYWHSKKGWVEIPFNDVEEGMLVTMYESDGVQVVMKVDHGDPKYSAVVTKGTYLRPDGIPTFEVGD